MVVRTVTRLVSGTSWERPLSTTMPRVRLDTRSRRFAQRGNRPTLSDHIWRSPTCATRDVVVEPEITCSLWDSGRAAHLNRAPAYGRPFLVSSRSFLQTLPGG